MRRSVVVGGAAQKLLPGAFLMGCGGVGCTVEAAFVEGDEPDLTGWADGEVAQVGIAEAHSAIQQRLPKFVDLLPQSIAYGGRLLGMFGDTRPQRATCYVA